jgi:hypothetical protein
LKGIEVLKKPVLNRQKVVPIILPASTPVATRQAKIQAIKPDINSNSNGW